MRPECLRRIDEQTGDGVAAQTAMAIAVYGLCAVALAAGRTGTFKEKLNRPPKVSRSSNSSCAARSPFRSGGIPARSAHCRRAWSSDRGSSIRDRSGCGAVRGE